MTNPSGSKDFAIPKHRTLQMRFILLAATISALAALAVGLFDYQRIVAQSHETAHTKMNAEEAILKGRLQDAYADFGSDALTFARSAAVTGLAAATMGEWIATRDPSQPAWKRQIETNAAAFLRAHPHYAQIRLIRADDLGREVVRVDQNSAGISVMPADRLQNKADRPYFQRGIAASPDSVVFSNVEFNVDFEVVNYNFATLRTMTPVYYNDNLFGIVVINVNYTRLIRQLLAASQFQGEIYIGAGSDAYFARSANGEIEYYSPDMMPGVAPAAASLIDDGRATAQMEFVEIDGRRAALHVSDIPVTGPPENRTLRIALVASNDEFAGLLSAIRERMIWTALAAAVAAATIAAFAGSRITTPLRKLTDDIRTYDLKGGAVAFGSSRRDEVGAISRALARLATHVESSQDALKDALARSRALRERSLDAMILIDEQGRIEDFNQAAVALFGYSASEAIGQNVSMLMPDPDRSAHDSYLAHYRATGERRIIGMPRHVQGLCKSGDIVEIELHVSEVEIGGRRLFDGTIRDIGRRVAMEQRFRQESEERRRSEERFALAMRGANDGLWDWNVRTGEVYYSPQYARMVGYEPGELKPNVRAWRPLIHPDDIERMVRQVALFLKGPDDAFQYDFRMLHKSGAVIDVLARGFRMKGDDGRVERVVGTHVDITELKRVQQDLTKRNEALDLLGQIAIATNAARSSDQALTDVLSLICGFLDWPVGHAFLRDEATGVLRATELWRLGDEAKYGPFRAASMKWDGRELPFIVDAMRERNARFAPDFASNDRYPRSGAAAACGLASGVAVPVLAHGEVEAVLEFFSSSGTAPEAHVMQVLNQTAPYIGRAIERNRARNRLEQAKQEAERANAAKTVFLTNMSHELRTPLNSVIGFSDILLGSKLEAAELEYVSHIKASGQHLLDLVNDLIDLSRIEEGRMEPRRSRFFMVAEIDSIIAQIEPQLLEKALTVATAIHGIDEMTTIHVEQRAFRIILLNLLSNAIKYSPAGGLIQVEAEARGRGCRLVVADKGPGLPEADLERAFERFEQLKGDAYDPGLGGAGIGLPLCRSLAELHGGSAWLERREIGGLRAIVDLPNCLDQARAANDTAAAPVEAPRRTDAPVVLLAEDDPINQKLIELMLRRLGCEVDVVADGEAAVVAASAGGYDLVILDVQMPVMSGLDAARRIRALPGARRDVTIVGLSADATAGSRERAVSAGMDDYFTKPATEADIARLLERRRGDGTQSRERSGA